jgi:hypothetical protein
MKVIGHDYVTAQDNIFLNASFAILNQRAVNDFIRQDLPSPRRAHRHKIQWRVVPLKNPLKAGGLPSVIWGEAFSRLVSAASDGGSYTYW